MNITKIFVFCIIAFFGLVLLPAPTDACSCAAEHPQTKYCNSEYVIYAYLTRRYLRFANNQIGYQFRVEKILKTSGKLIPNVQLSPKKRTIVLTTSPSDASCGVHLRPGRSYVIAARSTHIGICDYIKEYKKMTIVERRGVMGIYAKGCSCDIKTCFTNDCPAEEGTCSWSFLSPCETDYGVCIPTRGYNGPGEKPSKCHWKKSSPYLSCILAP
ncbi:Tissue inhibitor of metalloproteinase [Sergentomyia squamirostris]